MDASVQGWRTKWFYIKDRKISSSDKYGIAPFDASQELKKLASWDSPPTETEMEEIKPLLARIQELKGGRGGALSGTHVTPEFPEIQSARYVFHHNPRIIVVIHIVRIHILHVFV
jgi:hypothetical protein